MCVHIRDSQSQSGLDESESFGLGLSDSLLNAKDSGTRTHGLAAKTKKTRDSNSGLGLAFLSNTDSSPKYI